MDGRGSIVDGHWCMDMQMQDNLAAFYHYHYHYPQDRLAMLKVGMHRDWEGDKASRYVRTCCGGLLLSTISPWRIERSHAHALLQRMVRLGGTAEQRGAADRLDYHC
jgi:hypothetical protein